MADRTITERLQPSLLDRLTDLHPEAREERREERVIDIRRLRDIIRRDLSWLLNTSNAETWIAPQRHPHAANSVLNYGVREASGDFSSAERAEAIRQSIANAIARFEPRISAGSLSVGVGRGDKGRQTVITFDIHAEMWAQPLPMDLYLRTQVDVTSGQLSVEERG